MVDSLSPSRAFTVGNDGIWTRHVLLIIKTWDSHIFIVGNDVIWTRACVIENGSSEIKSYGCPLLFGHCYIQIKANTLFTFD